jgi:hypothetical protein
MLGLVITLAAAASAPQGAGSMDACIEGPSTGPTACEMAPAPYEGGEAAPYEVTFATPAVIDCRREVVPPVLSTLFGECDGTPHDTSYRVSRTGDEEASDKTVAAAPRERNPIVATCGGMPQRPPTLQLLDAQVMALAATPLLVPPETTFRRARDALELSTRFADPPDRPPRV